MGRIAPSTITLAVPDPDGQLIGSGAATLNAIHALAQHMEQVINGGSCGDGVSLMVFLPLPCLAADNPDGPVPLLFDHILAIASCARRAFKNEGGIFTMTGDVLPCFDASTLILPPVASTIITVPITLDIASNHGVIVASKTEILEESYTVSLVDNLLQKPSVDELVKNQAILDDGRALLDTGIIAGRGNAWVELAVLNYKILLRSLYEDLVAAWVPRKHDWLRHRPLGEALVGKLGKQRMFSYCAYDLLFLHFGTSSEVLDHLSESDSTLVDRRHLCSIPATTVSDIAASAVGVSCKSDNGVSIGEDSLIYDSSISGGIQIGSQTIVVGIHVPKDSDNKVDSSVKFMLPDRHCLWEVPLVGRIEENDLWSVSDSQDKCLWNAKLFPILSYLEMLSMAMWLMGLSDGRNQSFLPFWRKSPRVSFDELHRSIDFSKMCSGSSNHRADLSAGIAKACINYGMLGRNLSQLYKLIFFEHVERKQKLVSRSTKFGLQLLMKLLQQSDTVLELESSGSKSTKASGNNNHVGSLGHPFCPKTIKFELPVCVDFVGGWSDTPPWSLEHAGCVLIVETTNSSGVLITDDSGNELHIKELTSITPPFDGNDPFRLVKSALLVTGIIREDILVSNGLKIRTWANVPRGSGLGTSSILPAAVVKGLLQIIGGDDSNENVATLVLVLEQLMGTGGGWQDQIGGLYPGIKFTKRYPGIPLRLQVFPLVASPQLISELQQRLLVVFTGQVSSTSTSSPTKGEIMSEAWRLHQELDPYCSNEYVDKLFTFADPYSSGYKLVGADFEGFLVPSSPIAGGRVLRHCFYSDKGWAGKRFLAPRWHDLIWR
ncbi:Bifunctional fucokinase/fucose pyrophosphorylase [Hibiscus syriacus]|uniref:Bifunctional fucokinase/fucose pyrophosphorylase n=1 Tax=Hibiscus syriacus TaxID=106335 RepID=A0A6A3AL24_HIBSY|nr:Bifunctional fucokinase/fucose pyrophosphorylase [Hibiscus syriacus]